VLAGVVAVVGEFWAKQKPDRAQVNAIITSNFVLMAAELEEFSTG
jgi:hypothetical protein